MPLERTTNGLLARAADYEPLRAFSQGGVYWDKVPQQLIRDSSLAEFLPPVEVEKDDQSKYGRFHCEQGKRELLRHSKPLNGRPIPSKQLQRLKHAVEELKAKALDPGAQQHNRELIERFRLPNPSLEPELYRFIGSWWNRRLQVLWGCERTRDSSLPLSAAVERLAEDRFYNLRRVMATLLILLLLLLPAWWAATHWDQVRHWAAQVIQPPFAVPAQPPPEQEAATQAEKAQQAAKQAEAAAQKAQADADKAAADAQRAQQAADGTKADVDRKQKEAAEAATAAKKAQDIAKQARDAADRAKAAALDAQKTADQAKAAKPPALMPGAPAAGSFVSGQPSAPKSSGSPLPSPGAVPGMPGPAGATVPPAGTPAQAQAEIPGQIVLCDKGEPAADGTMAVSLEVRPLTGAGHALPVESWTYDGNTVTTRDRLRASLKGGDHVITATLLDSAGHSTTLQAVLTVQPGKVITTPGSVSLRPKTPP